MMPHTQTSRDVTVRVDEIETLAEGFRARAALVQEMAEGCEERGDRYAAVLRAKQDAYMTAAETVDAWRRRVTS